MARTVYCQEQGCGQEAAYILSDLADGGTQTFCMAHYIGLVIATAEAIQSQQAAEQPTAAAEDTITGLPADIVNASDEDDPTLDTLEASEAPDRAEIGA